jgi:dTDP-glucose pyrophosphorylase
MAGAGQRFSQAGYKTPKPLIPIGGKPMIFKALETIPGADEWIFVVRKEHVDEFRIDTLLKDALPKAKILIDPKPTGQATSCLLARDIIPSDAQLLIAGCDSGYDFDKRAHDSLVADPSVDAVVWTFTERETLQRNPTAWGWCELERDHRSIKRVSVKIPISPDPFHDHAVVSTFFFKRAADFWRATELMIAAGSRVNNEFYVDAAVNFLKELGKRSVIFDVDEYFSWGTPGDLSEYTKTYL